MGVGKQDQDKKVKTGTKKKEKSITQIEERRRNSPAGKIKTCEKPALFI